MAGPTSPRTARLLPTMASSLSCPQCAGPVAAQDFACAGCGLLLVEDVSTGTRGAPGVSVQSGESVEEALAAVAESSATAVFPLLADAEVPVAHTRKEEAADSVPLHALDAWVASLVDGERTLREVAEEAGITEVEVRAVLHSLRRRGLVELRHPQSSARAPAEPPRAAAPAERASPGAAHAVPLARIATRKLLVVVKRDEAPLTALPVEPHAPPAAEEG